MKVKTLGRSALLSKKTYEVLQTKSTVPTNFLDMVFEVLERGSVGKCVLHIRGIKTNHEQKVKIITLDYLLTEAENKYQEIEDWNGQKIESGFSVEDGCWNCGLPDHYVRECPEPDCRSARGCGGRG